MSFKEEILLATPVLLAHGAHTYVYWRFPHSRQRALAFVVASSIFAFALAYFWYSLTNFMLADLIPSAFPGLGKTAIVLPLICAAVSAVLASLLMIGRSTR